MRELRGIDDLQLDGRRVLMRADLNVPLDGSIVADDSRIRATLPGIRQVLDSNASLVLMSHLGRPGGRVDPKLSLRPVAERLQLLLERPVKLAPDSIGKETGRLADSLEAGEVLMLENTRFHDGEETNDPEYAKALASLGECFVNDAFGTAHREHASNVGITRHLPSAAGPLVEREVRSLGRLMNGERPFIVILGGAKADEKMKLITSVMNRADRILVGGVIANTLLRAQGHDMADSMVEERVLDEAQLLLTKWHGALELPKDLVIADHATDRPNVETIVAGDVPEGRRVVDVGNATLRHFEEVLFDSKAVFWNGPLGMAEAELFAGGTLALAQTLAELEAFVVVGGGDTVAAIEKAGVSGLIDHVSTGGGASLAFLRGEILPALEPLQRS